MSLAEEIDGARDYTALFRLVKRLVERRTGKSRAGIMLGLSRLGLSPNGYLGGYFVVGSNAIVLNRDVLDYVKVTHPEFHNAYAFHVLLHEYLHTLGWFREDEVRPMALELTEAEVAPDHPAALIAAAMTPGRTAGVPEMFRRLFFPEFGRPPAEAPAIDIVKGFDPDASPYIG